MRIFKNKPFARFARKSEISDSDLCKTVADAERGTISADLGGGIIKQRIAREGSGKSGGFRVLLLFKVRDIAVFVHGFAKNDVGNIRADELTAVKKLARSILAFDEDELERAVQSGTLTEVRFDGDSEAIS